MRRTRANITNEYNKFKGLDAGIQKMIENKVYDKVDKDLKTILDRLVERETCLKNLSELEETSANQGAINEYYEKLNNNDKYFGQLSNDVRKKSKQLFLTANNDLLKYDVWHKAYNAFMVTQVFEVSNKINDANKTNKELQERVNTVTKSFHNALANERKSNPNLNAQQLLADIKKLRSQKTSLSKVLSENEESYNKVKKEFEPLEKNLKDCKYQKDRAEQMLKDKAILENVVKTMKEEFLPLEKQIKDAKMKMHSLAGWKLPYDFENKRDKFKTLKNSCEKNTAKGKNYNEMVKIAQENFALFTPLFFMKKKLIDSMKKENVGEVKLAYFSKDDYYSKAFREAADKYGMDYDELLQLDLDEYEDVLDSIKQQNLENNKEIINGLDPEDKKMFENLETDFVKIRTESKEIYNQYKMEIDELKKLEVEIPIMDKKFNEFRASLAKEVSKTTTERYKPSLIEVEHFEYFNERLGILENNTKDMQTIEDNYKNAKIAYDSFSPEKLNIVKEYEKNKNDLKKVKENLEKNINVKDNMKNIKGILDEYKRAVKDQKQNSHDMSPDVIINELALNADELYKDQNSFCRMGHINSSEFNKMTGMLKTISQYAKKEEKDVDKFKEDLDKLKEAADKYIVAKNKQTRNNPTAQRRFRLEYAEWLKGFATYAQEQLEREVISIGSSSKQDFGKETTETKENQLVEQEEMEAYDALDSM